jgi:hypothetical protein
MRLARPTPHSIFLGSLILPWAHGRIMGSPKGHTTKEEEKRSFETALPEATASILALSKVRKKSHILV